MRGNEFNNSSKKKMLICSPYNTICINDSKVDAITIDDTYKYLCIYIDPIDNRRFVEYINVKLILIDPYSIQSCFKTAAKTRSIKSPHDPKSSAPISIYLHNSSIYKSY